MLQVLQIVLGVVVGVVLGLAAFMYGAYQRDKQWATALKLPRTMTPQELVKTHSIDLHLRWRHLSHELVRSRFDCQVLREAPRKETRDAKDS